ncbi:hypothetical protein [Holophaga foetida]|uniref:hypothetical protein n=1 Tax=Holophaga foetida TaxID=35839 RepID=UPI0002475098|nr:hypothetical protein [Holophaga foetida]
MRNSSLLAAGLLLFLGCQRPSSTVNYSPLENLPPKTAQRAQEGGLAIWALAAVDGRVEFYLLAPRNSVPEQLTARMGWNACGVEKRSELGRTYFTWTAQLGKEGVLKPMFQAPMLVEVRLPGGGRRCMTVLGLGTDSYPVLNMCYFDIPWEPAPCP